MPLDDHHLQHLRDAANTAEERIYTNWRVVSGPPFSGKTTLVDSLGSCGYQTVADCGRRAICENLQEGRTKVDARSDFEGLQRRISDLTLDEALVLAPSDIVVWDYSLPDNLAYLAVTGHGWPEIFIERAIRFHFKQVFLLQPVGDIDHFTDPVRVESLAFSLELYKAMKTVYETLGTEVVEVLELSRESRLNRAKAYLEFD
ncbi:AAA family ATPase [Paraburkholderia megapolitana]|uniref:AAA family ATPase n=1 Tax=Paraburkholderia megapolitana TaxID=420953 RepID=UPI0038B750CF